MEKRNGTVKGIVATSSYEARSMGIKTGMSAYEAYKCCPYICMLQVTMLVMPLYQRRYIIS